MSPAAVAGRRQLPTPRHRAELRSNLKEYRKAWHQAGHPGDGDVSLRIPVYAGDTPDGAVDEPWESIKSYFGRMGTLYRESAGKAGIDATELRQGRADTLAALSYEQILKNKVAFGTAAATAWIMVFASLILGFAYVFFLRKQVTSDEA